MAEARSAIAEPQVRYHDEGTSQVEQQQKVAKSFYQNLKICAFRTRKQIRNGLWPTTWHNLLIALAVVSCVMYIDHPKLNMISKHLWAFADYIHLDETYPYFFRLFTVAFIISVTYFIVLLYTRQYMLRGLLSYMRWLYEPPRMQSILTLMWGITVRIVSGRHPSLYSYQNSLPRMSVPSLRNTISGFLDSIRPIVDDEEFRKMEASATEFECTVGPKLQRILHLKSWWAPNYITDWWEKYVYLMSRTPIAINSNYYGLDQSGWVPTRVQTSRAAGVVYLTLCFKKKVQTEELEPLVIRDTIPLCMHQYERIFGTVRVPGEEIDRLKYSPDSEHIVVFCKGHYYKLHTVDAHGIPLGVLDLESQFEWIKKDAEHQPIITDGEASIAALTASERTHWARVRKEHFGTGINKDSLESIESALLVVVLEDKAFSELSPRAKYILHGDGKSLWFDKSVSLVVFEDGKCGVNCEHAWADAPVIAHMMEDVFTEEFLYRVYNDRGTCKPFGGQSSMIFKRSKALITPLRLYWDVNPPLEKIINDALIFARKNNDDLDLKIGVHSAFGKGFIKTCKMSPDAFIQSAFQLTYYKLSGGKFALTYESCMTRLFLHGRTETVRSLTAELAAFCTAMGNPSVSNEEKIKLLRKAASKHQRLYRNGMAGKGIDRHLFALYVVCRGQGYESPFLKSALTLPWTLSTSQQPQQQMNKGFDIGIPEVKETISPGGGFGPVSDHGYGVSYMVPDDAHIFFHVSSKFSSPHTSSERFMETLFETLREIKEIFVSSHANGKP